MAQDAGPDAPERVEQRPEDPDQVLSGYPDEQQPVVGETDAEEDLNDSFPKKDSVFDIGVPQDYFKWKEELYEEVGLKLGFSYQMLYQHASDTAPFGNDDTALGHWWGITSKWTLLNRGKDYEGSLVFTAHERVSVGGNAVPAQFGGGDVGSSWSNFEWTEWDFSVEDLYWEQWLEKDRFMFRIGNQIPTTIYNSFRFKDARTSFTSSPFAFHESIPYPTYGLGGAFKWWPGEGSEFYIVGTLNDMNGNPNDGFDWSTFGEGQYFYGIEFGYNWRREGGEFDHVHLDLFYADERSNRSPDTLPNKAGGGFKLLGSKQWGRFVAFGSYTFNTAEGGGISVTFARQTATAGVALLRPFGLGGEAALGLMWMELLPDLIPDFNMRDQYGMETYWKIRLTHNVWITPGIQVIFDPAFNPDEDVVVIPHIKFRYSF